MKFFNLKKSPQSDLEIFFSQKLQQQSFQNNRRIRQSRKAVARCLRRRNRRFQNARFLLVKSILTPTLVLKHLFEFVILALANSTNLNEQTSQNHSHLKPLFFNILCL